MKILIKCEIAAYSLCHLHIYYINHRLFFYEEKKNLQSKTTKTTSAQLIQMKRWRYKYEYAIKSNKSFSSRMT